MAQLSCPRPSPSRSVGLPLGLCLGALLSVVPVSSAAAAPLPSIKTAVGVSELAAELSLQPDAASAEAWLAQHIPTGTTLADHPHFFATAHEVFFDGEDNVLVFVYRSVSPSRWVAWVSFDAERIGVIDTSASDL